MNERAYRNTLPHRILQLTWNHRHRSGLLYCHKLLSVYSIVYLLIMAFVYQIDGYVSRITVLYCLFKSLPVSELRVFPTITPSGLSIGTSLKINLWRSRLATVVSPVIKSIKPFIIHEDGVSLGWTRADTTIDFCAVNGICNINNNQRNWDWTNGKLFKNR